MLQAETHRSSTMEFRALRGCVGFDSDRVNFLHNSWYGAMPWICAGNGVDNTGTL